MNTNNIKSEVVDAFIDTIKSKRIQKLVAETLADKLDIPIINKKKEKKLYNKIYDIVTDVIAKNLDSKMDDEGSDNESDHESSSESDSE